MRKTRKLSALVAFAGGAFIALPAFALTFDLPAPSTPTREEISPGTTYSLPNGPFDGEAVPSQTFEGSILKQAWKVQIPSISTFDLMAQLRSQLTEQGFSPLFECAASECGGFDFRYGIETLPEPEMHVDLGDFRFLSATKDAEAVSVLVSRSSAGGFAQIVHVDPMAQVSVLSGSSMSDRPAPETDEGPDPESAAPNPIIDELLQKGAAVLSDIDFRSGSFDLAPGRYGSLKDIGEWMTVNRDIRIALVGHTDASGTLDANVTLSERRAQAVRQRLIDVHKIDPARIEAKGVGYLAPRDTNQTESGRRNNRRVEVIVTSTPSLN